MNMNDLKEMSAHVGEAIPWKFGDYELKLKPFTGGYLSKVLNIRDQMKEPMLKAKGDLSKLEMYCESKTVEDLHDLMAEWIDKNMGGEVPEGEERIDIILTFLDMNFNGVVEAFFSIHGFDKQTSREELKEEVGKDIEKERKRNARKPRKDRNQPSGIAR